MEESTFLYHAACPTCGSPDALAVYDTGTATCFSCGTYHPFYSGGPAATLHNSYKVKQTYKKLLPVYVTALPARQLTLATCKYYGYGGGRLFGHTYQVATYYWQDAPAAQHLRTRDKKFSWIGNTAYMQLYGQQLFKAGGERVYINEGEIDCMTVFQVLKKLYPSVSIPSGVTSAKKYFLMNYDWLNSFDEIVLCFDTDVKPKAVEAVAKSIAKCMALFEPGKIKLAALPLKDPNAMLKAGQVKELIYCLLHPETFEGEKL